jgi:hypothetical protein
MCCVCHCCSSSDERGLGSPHSNCVRGSLRTGIQIVAMHALSRCLLLLWDVRIFSHLSGGQGFAAWPTQRPNSVALQIHVRVTWPRRTPTVWVQVSLQTVIMLLLSPAPLATTRKPKRCRAWFWVCLARGVLPTDARVHILHVFPCLFCLANWQTMNACSLSTVLWQKGPGNAPVACHITSYLCKSVLS